MPAMLVLDIHPGLRRIAAALLAVRRSRSNVVSMRPDLPPAASSAPTAEDLEDVLTVLAAFAAEPPSKPVIDHGRIQNYTTTVEHRREIYGRVVRAMIAELGA